MADTYTTSLNFRIQTVGGNSNTWGDYANTNWTNVDTAIAGVLSKSLASADVTLSASENNYPVVRCTGTLTADRNLIVQNYVKRFWISNETSGAYTVTVKTSAGTGVTVSQGSARLVYCDGTNVAALDVEMDFSTLGDLAYLDTVDTAQVADGAITLAKMDDMATSSFLGRTTSGTGAPEVLSVASVKTLLGNASSSAAGLQAAWSSGDDTASKIKVLAAGGTYIRQRWVEIGYAYNASAAQYIQATSGLTDYQMLMLEFYGEVTTSDTLFLQVGTTGPSWLATNEYAYRIQQNQVDRSTASTSDVSTDNAGIGFMPLHIGLIQAGGAGFNGRCLISGFAETRRCVVKTEMSAEVATDDLAVVSGAGIVNSSSALSAIRVGFGGTYWAADGGLLISGRRFD